LDPSVIYITVFIVVGSLAWIYTLWKGWWIYIDLVIYEFDLLIRVEWTIIRHIASKKIDRLVFMMMILFLNLLIWV
jgi:hypothetical protein